MHSKALVGKPCNQQADIYKSENKMVLITPTFNKTNTEVAVCFIVQQKVE